jgi:hypothetical protein
VENSASGLCTVSDMPVNCMISLPRVACAVIATALVLAPVVAAEPATAATAAASQTAKQSGVRGPKDGTTGFTAVVQSINHGLRRVTLRGTAPRGTSVELSGDVLETVWTEAGPDGRWTGQVRVSRGEDLRIRVMSAVSGAVVELPVHVQSEVFSPLAEATVDDIARSITVHLTGGAPKARFELYDGTRHVDTVRADADGEFTYVFTDLGFGSHHLEAWQYYDGEHNGGWDEVFRITGAPVIDDAAVRREDGVTRLTGRAPAGTTLTIADDAGPVLGADGEPVTVPVGGAPSDGKSTSNGKSKTATRAAGTTWTASIPIPADTRFVTYHVTSHIGDIALGSADVAVTIPNELTGTVEELADGTVRLVGTGEPSGVVALETEDGDPIDDAAGAPITTTIARSWEIVVPRAELPDGAVIARQRVGGVEQGALRLVLPKLPVHPNPGGGNGNGGGNGSGGGNGTGHGTGASGAGSSGAINASSGVHTSQRATSGALRSSTGRLAYTGSEPRPAVIVGALLLLTGVGALTGAHLHQRRHGAGRRGRRAQRG